MVLFWSIGILVTVFILCYLYMLKEDDTKILLQSKRVLLVIAHPDDESLFFGPTILKFLSLPISKLFVLCLSKGKMLEEI